MLKCSQASLHQNETLPLLDAMLSLSCAEAASLSHPTVASRILPTSAAVIAISCHCHLASLLFKAFIFPLPFFLTIILSPQTSCFTDPLILLL